MKFSLGDLKPRSKILNHQESGGNLATPPLLFERPESLYQVMCIPPGPEPRKPRLRRWGGTFKVTELVDEELDFGT